MSDLTPMLRQYMSIKEEYPDCVLFFRMGDFYEMFFDDAREAAPILEIALTTRDKNRENPVPMCGIPYHAAESYIEKLVNRGRKVAVCEQVEDPSQAKGIVRREVIRVVTPGLSAALGKFNAAENNYLCGVSHKDDRFGAAFLDFSTGVFQITELSDLGELMDQLAGRNPQEVVLSEDEENSPLADRLSRTLGGALVNFTDNSRFGTDRAVSVLTEVYDLAGIEGLGLGGHPLALTAAGGVLSYVVDYKLGDVTHLSLPRLYLPTDFMIIDEVTGKNLELFRTVYEGRRTGSLLSVMDRTTTSMGARLLKRTLAQPMIDRREIERRHDLVQELVERQEKTDELVSLLADMADLERIAGRVSTRIANPRDVAALASSLGRIGPIRRILEGFESVTAASLAGDLDDFSPLIRRIVSTLVESPPHTLRDGGLIKDGVDEELDELREISRTGKQWIIDLEKSERRRTGINSLKVRFNKVFGYYIEVSNTNLQMVPEDYIRKQTLVSAERFITPELKEFEAKVLGAQDRITALEYDIFVKLREEVRDWIPMIQKGAGSLAALDMLLSFAVVAREHDFIRPIMTDKREIDITGGRHPMVEGFLPSGSFVPNDVHLDAEHEQLLIITGPNMAGKSTIIRQVALIVLMAHTGSFVPAEKATIGIVDRIFSRVGASDSIARGQSTFMVEMVETANILNNATERSLVILDEIGRGTSTFDGVSIAWAVAEYLHDSDTHTPLTLFATHYHELTELAVLKERIKNYTISVREWNGRIIFVHKMQPGSASHSYGIEVARLAGLPSRVLARAREILQDLEEGELLRLDDPESAAAGSRPHPSGQLDLLSAVTSPVVERLRRIDVNTLTPLDALSTLDELIRLSAQVDAEDESKK
ncbi:MAG: DNA mismatch repair protein MutS [Deltaproteobacteria bacterium]|nr:DNA mismatch repair protein MutS [Candidatus Zymogenaceae bacterium]